MNIDEKEREWTREGSIPVETENPGAGSAGSTGENTRHAKTGEYVEPDYHAYDYRKEVSKSQKAIIIGIFAMAFFCIVGTFAIDTYERFFKKDPPETFELTEDILNDIWSDANNPYADPDTTGRASVSVITDQPQKEEWEDTGDGFLTKNTDVKVEAVYSELPKDADANILSLLGKDDNFVYSPYSCFSTFALYNELFDPALSLEQRETIRNMIGNPQNYIQKLSQKLSDAAETLPTPTPSASDSHAVPDNDICKSVNRIWINNAYKESVSEMTSNAPENLKALFYFMDMEDEELATLEKDLYVSDATDGFIDHTPTRLNNKTLIDFMNILYFHGKWDTSVDFEYTSKEKPFANADGSKKDVAMLKTTSRTTYYETDDAYGYHLLYALADDGTEYQMCVILPKEPDADLGKINMEAFLPNGSAEGNSVDVIYFYMPEFSMESTWEMKNGTPAWEAYSLPSLALSVGDLGFTPEFTQVAKIKVDKEGTTAAAVSELQMTVATAVDIEPKLKKKLIFNCNRPFLFYVYDATNGSVLFAGQVKHL